VETSGATSYLIQRNMCVLCAMCVLSALCVLCALSACGKRLAAERWPEI